MSLTLSQRLAHYVLDLSCKDLPDRVAERVKGRLLHGFVTGLAGFRGPTVQGALRVVRNLEKPSGQATVIGSSDRLNPLTAAFLNSLMLGGRNQSDSYRILTHPGAVVLPSALAAGEIANASGQDFLTAVAAGLEVETRMASGEQTIKTVQLRGFRASCTFGVFGSAVAAGKVLGLSEAQFVHCLGLAATFASGTAEGQRWGTDETSIQDAQASRNGLWAALLAREGLRSTETALDGEVGFFQAFTGGGAGDLSCITDELGHRFELMKIASKTFPAVGFNQLPTILMGSMARRHRIQPEAVGAIVVDISHEEVFYPNAQFAKHWPLVGLTEYYVAMGCVHHEFPQVISDSHIRASAVPGEAAPPSADPVTSARVFEVAKKVFVHFSKERPIYNPRITVRMKDGRTFTEEITEEALHLDVDDEVKALKPLLPLTGLSPARWKDLVATIRRVEELPNLAPLVALVRRGEEGAKARRSR